MRFEMQSSRDVGDGVVVLSVHGDLDGLTAPLLTDEISAELAGNPSTLIVDLLDVDFLASAGMAAIMAGHQSAGFTRFAVVAYGPVTARPLEMLGLNQLLDVYPTIAAAVG